MLKSSVRSDDDFCNESRSDGHKSICRVYEFYVIGGIFMAVKLSQSEFINRAEEIHNHVYDYSLVRYVNTYTKVKIVCKMHGVFEQDPHNHLKGKGCPLCASNHKLSKQDFVRKASAVHNNFYDYSSTNYIRNAGLVSIRCPIHGEFIQEANSHLQGHGCPECGRDKISQCDYSKRSLTREKTCLARYGVSNSMRVQEFKNRNLQAKFDHNTFNSSVIEELVNDKLVTVFGTDDVVRQYKSDEYSYRCDFYIRSLDLYLEVNAFWTHNTHWFDEHNLDDINDKNKFIEKYGDRWGSVWWESDVRKRQTAILNNLNYVVLWNEKDVIDWFDLGCPVANDAIKQYSWR